jgi:site-specific DNA-cytosine methylase
VVNTGGGQVVATANGSEHSAASEGDRGDLGVRRLTPLECERLQGFPDGWTDGQSDSARYRMLGNAVAVPVVQWIADRLVKLDGGNLGD